MSSRLDELLDLHADAALDGDQQQELLRLLEKPEERRQLWRHALLSTALVEECASSALVENAANPSADHSWWRRQWLLIASLAAALVAAIAILQWRQTRPNDHNRPHAAKSESFARISAGSADVLRKDRTEHLDGGDDLRIADVVMAGHDGATVSYQDGSSLALSAGTKLRLAAPNAGEGKHAALEVGGLEADIAHQTPGHPLIVSTPAARVEVVGTKFSLHHTDAGTDLALREGKVRFTDISDNRSALVLAGQRASAFVPFSSHWDFAKGPAADITVLRGAWHWQGSAADSSGSMSVSKTELTILRLPITPAPRPFLMTCHVTITDPDAWWFVSATWSDGKRVEGHKNRYQYWPYGASGSFILKIFYQGPFVTVHLERIGGESLFLNVYEFDRAYPMPWPCLELQNISLSDIECRSLRSDEYPEWGDDPRTLTKGFAEQMVESFDLPQK